MDQSPKMSKERSQTKRVLILSFHLHVIQIQAKPIYDDRNQIVVARWSVINSKQVEDFREADENTFYFVQEQCLHDVFKYQMNT